MKKKFTKNTVLSEILDYSGTEKVLAKYSLPCLNCPLAELEMGKLKIGDVCRAYDIDIKKLLKELNRLL